MGTLSAYLGWMQLVCIRNSLGLLLGVEAPVMTSDGTNFSFLETVSMIFAGKQYIYN